MSNVQSSSDHRLREPVREDVKQRSPTKLTHARMVRLALENDIFTGRLPPGSPVDEEALAERFSVSRTPVREAMQHLIQTGLIEKSSRRRATVIKLDLRRLIHCFETVSELEGLCARFAVRRITTAERSELIETHEAAAHALATRAFEDYARLGRQFHSVIIQATHNSVLIETTDKLALFTLPYRRFQLKQEGRSEANQHDHGKILAAVVAGNESEAHDLMRRHVTVQGDVLAEYIAMGNATVA
jgi:DNA-binding GntR family transcriptional regulator